jgi:DNA-binding transcriptional ArsR family regulator
VNNIGFQDTLDVLSNSISRSILDLIKTEKLSAGQIAEKLHMTPAATSYHLAKLKKAELVYETKYKNFIYYEVNLSVLDDVVLWINNLKGEKQK